jgi:hypothetical protein
LHCSIHSMLYLAKHMSTSFHSCTCHYPKNAAHPARQKVHKYDTRAILPFMGYLSAVISLRHPAASFSHCICPGTCHPRSIPAAITLPNNLTLPACKKVHKHGTRATLPFQRYLSAVISLHAYVVSFHANCPYPPTECTNTAVSVHPSPTALPYLHPKLRACDPFRSNALQQHCSHVRFSPYLPSSARIHSALAQLTLYNFVYAFYYCSAIHSCY